MERIIYVIPYTSIIEQTASVFREIFGEENVIEHHSNASYEIREGDDLAQYKRVKATENWDAPIIVTTAVQFFESLYANRSSKCRKLHNIANSVLIFDEAQMLPTEHLRPCVAAVAKLVSNFQSTAVLCTATQPVLNDLFEEYAFGYEIEELCPRKDEMFSAFRRVKFENIGEVDAGELSGRLAENEQVLCVVNSRKSAQEIFERLPEEGRFHLSTLMYPAHRREVLDKIRTRLQEGKLCRVVSTSLIEAGVDVDFPAAFREMAGLDSILQAAGRCNREGKRSPDESIVTIFHGVSTTPSLLKVNIGATKEIMSAGLDFAESDTIQRYFKAFRSLAGNKMDREDVVAAFEEGIQGCSMPFRSVAESFRLINSNTKTVYIPLGKGFDLVERLRSGEHSRKLFRELGQYGVNIYENHYLSLMSGGSLEIMDEDCAVLMNTDLYSSEVGLALSENQELAIFA